MVSELNSALANHLSALYMSSEGKALKYTAINADPTPAIASSKSIECHPNTPAANGNENVPFNKSPGGGVAIGRQLDFSAASSVSACGIFLWDGKTSPPVVAGILVCSPYPPIASSLSSEAREISLLETTNSISQCGHFSLDPKEIAGRVIKRLQYGQRI